MMKNNTNTRLQYVTWGGGSLTVKYLLSFVMQEE